MRDFFETAHDERGAGVPPDPVQVFVPLGAGVLDAVDAVFSAAGRPRRPDRRSGGDRARGGARRGARPGRDLADWSSPTKSAEVDPWDAPFDTSSETSPRVKLARQIAAAVKIWLERGDLVGDGDKRHRLRAGDMLDSGAPARRAVRGDHPRAEERRRPGRRRRPAGADRAHRGDGPAGAGRRAAAAGRRSGAGDGAEEPAVRLDRGRAVRARVRPARLVARGAARAAARSRGAARRAGRRRAASSRRSRSTPSCSAPAAGARRSWRGSGPRPTTRSTNSSISRSTTRAARRRRCKASSRGCAPRRRRSSATWRWRATRCG